MSHQTGIHASEELRCVFSQCKSKREIRCIKLLISNEQIVCDDKKPMSATNNFDWKDDWRQYMVGSFLPKQKPAYVFFRLAGTDTQDIVVTTNQTITSTNTQQKNAVAPPKPNKPVSLVQKLGPPKLASLLSSSLNNNNNNNNNNSINKSNVDNDKNSTKYDNLPNEASKDMWLFVSWTPDSSSVRDKMIYASTKSSVKQEFGGGSIFADYFVSSYDDLSLESVKKWIERKQHIRDGRVDMNELSISEQELHNIKAQEAALCADLLASSMKDKSKTLPSIEMPIAEEAMQALNDFKQGKSSYVQLSIDPKTETILLEKNVLAKEFDLSKKSIASLTPKEHARYHLVSFSHQHSKNQTKATLFIYSIPLSGCPVKERMLYSSVKNSLLQVIQDTSKLSIVVDRKIETDDPSELTGKFLYDELYPNESAPPTTQPILKPKGPPKQNPSSASRRRVM